MLKLEKGKISILFPFSLFLILTSLSLPSSSSSISCTIQNCILGGNTIIGNNCNMNECYSGKSVKVNDGSRLKSEVLTTHNDNSNEDNSHNDDAADFEEKDDENNT